MSSFKVSADIARQLRRSTQLRNIGSVHVFAVSRSTASFFAPLRLFLAAFAKLKLMEGGGRTQARLYNSYNDLSCYCFLTGRDSPCISQSTRVRFSCFRAHAGVLALSAAGSGLKNFVTFGRKADQRALQGL